LKKRTEGTPQSKCENGRKKMGKTLRSTRGEPKSQSLLKRITESPRVAPTGSTRRERRGIRTGIQRATGGEFRCRNKNAREDLHTAKGMDLSKGERKGSLSKQARRQRWARNSSPGAFQREVQFGGPHSESRKRPSSRKT